MRVSHWIFPALLAMPGPLQGQSDHPTWSVTLALEGVRFAAAARDTAAPAASAADLRPSGRVGVRLALRRAIGGWGVELAAGWAQGNVEAANEAVAIRDRTADLSRYRLAPGVERVLGRLGGGELALGASPTLDLWSLDGDTRLRVGAECGLALRLPVGRASVENRISVGVSASPLEVSDLGQEFELGRLRAVAFSVGVRVPL